MKKAQQVRFGANHCRYAPSSETPSQGGWGRNWRPWRPYSRQCDATLGLGREIAAHAVDAAAGQVNSLAAYLGEVRLAGSIPFPGDGPEVVTVGAITLEGKRASFSACGPNSCRPKPDLVAPIPFATFLRDTPFSGTSCATPQAASVAALCWSANPDWTASHVRSYVTSHARDLGPAGYDTETGYGTVHLPAIAPAPRALSPKPFAVSR